MECSAVLDLLPDVPEGSRRFVRRLVQTTHGLWLKQRR
jgi:hypothetical protein